MFTSCFVIKKGDTFSHYVNIIDINIKEVKELSPSPKIASFPSRIFSFENSPRIRISLLIDPNCNIVSSVKPNFVNGH